MDSDQRPRSYPNLAFHQPGLCVCQIGHQHASAQIEFAIAHFCRAATSARILARSWWLSWCLYRLHRLPLVGPPEEEVWDFAYGANMHDSVFRGWRGMRPLDWRPGRAAELFERLQNLEKGVV